MSQIIDKPDEIDYEMGTARMDAMRRYLAELNELENKKADITCWYANELARIDILEQEKRKQKVMP